jgi:hypothetical protein
MSDTTPNAPRSTAERHQPHGPEPDPRTEEYVHLGTTPQTIQAWREANELAGS